MSNPTADILQLAALITQSTYNIIQEYKASGASIPDLEGTDPNAVLISPSIRKAIHVMEGAYTQLLATVAPPDYNMITRCYHSMDAACLRVVVRGRIADQLRDGPKPVAELAKVAGINSIHLGKVLRLLAIKHCFTEVEPDVFANNRLSAIFLSERDTGSLQAHVVDEQYLGFTRMVDSVFSTGGKNITADTTGAALALGLPMFKRFDAEPYLGERFARAMLAWTKINGGAEEITRIYPWATVPQDSTFCDVGGGLGHLSLALIKAFPHLKVVVQDLPAILEDGKKMWQERHPQAVAQGRVHFEPFNFLEQNAFSGCDYYFLKHILHDWPDEDCIKILTGVRNAVGPNSKVLINEFIIYNATPTADLGGATPYPAPLLPNGGGGAMIKHYMDINMLSNFGGVERGLSDFVRLANATGFRFSKFWPAEGELSLLELVPV